MEQITKGHPLSQSPDLVKENIETLKALFPTIVKEGKIDLEELKALLGDELETSDEYYRFTWAGKAMARREANKPSTATLRPNKKDSKDWDTTQNIFIEGDNLEALKLLQKSYANKIKMIYIDPPYNTGKDFVYKDNYNDNLSNYLQITGQVDEEGKKISTNTESDGRYHSNWLNMMYPRLKLALNLMAEDGVIFISIDDNEVHNLRKISDEVFGEVNFIGLFCRKTKSGGGSASDTCAIEHDYVLTYARNTGKVSALIEDFGEKYLTRYKESDDIGPYFWDTMERSSTATKPYIIMAPDGTPLKGKWFRSEATFLDDLKTGEVRFLKKPDGWSVQFKQRLSDGKKLRTIMEDNHLTDKQFRSLNEELEDILGFSLGHPPKPLSMMKILVNSVCNKGKNDIILDFFAGSGTTGHAVMKLNAEDGGKRKFICVQLPEQTQDDTEAYKAGYKTVSKITKERLRRVGENISVEMQTGIFSAQGQTLDIGFRAFKLDSSNIKAWDGEPENLEKNLFNIESNIKEDRTEEDVLYEILLKYGLDLTLPIEQREIAGKVVFNIGLGTLFICLATDITTAVAEGIGKWKQEQEPASCKVIFRDNGFTDVEKTNSIQILKRYGIEEVNSI